MIQKSILPGLQATVQAYGRAYRGATVLEVSQRWVLVSFRISSGAVRVRQLKVGRAGGEIRAIVTSITHGAGVRATFDHRGETVTLKSALLPVATHALTSRAGEGLADRLHAYVKAHCEAMHDQPHHHHPR